MSVSALKELSYRDVQHWFKQQMQLRKMDPETIATYYSDAFYVWRKENAEVFWKLVESNDFENDMKVKVVEVLEKHSKGNVKVNKSSYFIALKTFREFCVSENLGAKTSNSDRIAKQNIRSVKTKQNVGIPKPCISEVNKYLKEWNDNEKFVEQEKVLTRLFKETYPLNDTIEGVLAKVTILNVFYSTNILAFYPVVKHIVSKDIDDKLKQGDVSVVDDIRRMDRDNYSFATKYCSNHYPEVFPIYDSYVEKVLCYFRNCDNFTSFKTEELRQYKKFKEIIIAFRKYYDLEIYDLKKIDIYLWMVGKKYFAKN